MEKRIAVMAVVVESTDCIGELNNILHEYGEYIIGRMGIPYHARNINLISVAIDAPEEVIISLREKLAALPGVRAETAMSDKLD